MIDEKDSDVPFDRIVLTLIVIDNIHCFIKEKSKKLMNIEV